MPAVDDKRMRALAAAMVRESERETLQGIRLELEQVGAGFCTHAIVSCLSRNSLTFFRLPACHNLLAPSRQVDSSTAELLHTVETHANTV